MNITLTKYEPPGNYDGYRLTEHHALWTGIESPMRVQVGPVFTIPLPGALGGRRASLTVKNSLSSSMTIEVDSPKENQ